MNKTCWCGNSDLKDFSQGYMCCTACQTLISQIDFPKDQDFDDQTSFYGKNYWLSHMTNDLGLADIFQRTRTDLTERCLYWLRTLLKYKLPPAKILELGSMHGGLVGLLRQVGYDAMGLDLSPWVAEYAKETFHVPMLIGSIEKQTIESQSLDIIILMDVLEHLPHPVDTIQHCLKLLKPDGFLVIQTPMYPFTTYENMIVNKSRFIEMLQPNEHLYLFSKSSVTQFFKQLDLNYLQFERALFDHYDMFFVASKTPIAPVHNEKTIHEFLNSSPEKRYIQALLDLADKHNHLLKLYQESEEDRGNRLVAINNLQEKCNILQNLCRESEQDRANFLTQIKHLEIKCQDGEKNQSAYLSMVQLLEKKYTDLQEIFKKSTEDQSQLLSIIDKLNAQKSDLTHSYNQLSEDKTQYLSVLCKLEDQHIQFNQLYKESLKTRAHCLSKINELENQYINLQALYNSSEKNNHIKLLIISELKNRITELNNKYIKIEEEKRNSLDNLLKKYFNLEQERNQYEMENHQLHQRYKDAEEDRKNRLTLINTLSDICKDLQNNQVKLEIQLNKTFDFRIKNTVKRLLTRNQNIKNVFIATHSVFKNGIIKIFKFIFKNRINLSALQIMIDLTPILPGGENGGAKIFTLNLVKNISLLAPKYNFFILATENNIHELKELASKNVKIISVSKMKMFRQNEQVGIFKLFIRHLKYNTPAVIKNNFKPVYYNLLSKVHYLRSAMKPKMKIDLLFCPFTAPYYHSPLIPTVSTVYDLQFHYYPYFFSETTQIERQKNFQDACNKASKLICISEYVRKSVIEQAKILPEKVKTVYIQLARRLPSISAPFAYTLLKRMNLAKQNYLLFPANFWPHKNHKILITAFSMYCHAYPESKLKLVCTGADSLHKKELLQHIETMQLSEKILMPGFISDDEFAALLLNTKAVIFPSLYEGFGMPVIEAMSANIPVLCSNVTSLPEVIGEAAITFDPRKPQDILQAIETLDRNNELLINLKSKGKHQADQFKDELAMAKEYLNIFKETVKETMAANL